jgi:flavin-dependent dehydrogenase
MRLHFDAIIVGAGPAGSSAAILLARAGWTVALVERRAFPRRKVCGECIAASNLPLLEALGVVAEFEACAGPPLVRVGLMRGAQALVADLPAAGTARYRWGRALGRERLDTLLLEQARGAGAQVLQPWRAQAIEGAPGAWRCRVCPPGHGDAVELRAPVAIDAHGSWEPPPGARGGWRPARRAGDLLAFKANFRDATIDAGLLPVLSLVGGYGGMVLADGNETTVACCIRRDRFEALRAQAPGARAGDVVEAWLRRECAGVERTLRGAVRTGPWLAAGPIVPGIRVRADDAVFRIGNAAGEAHPILGEGISMALQSAALLCPQLLAGGHHQAPSAAEQREIARRYAAGWRQHFAPRLRLAAVFGHAAMRRAPAAVLMAMARAWPGLLTHGARWGGKVSG